MAASNSTTTATCNSAADVSSTYLADAAMFIRAAMRLVDMKDGEAFCLLDKAHCEINAAQDYLEEMDLIESRIEPEIAAMLARIGRGH